ncbi:MAG: multidrug transporter [Fibrobacteres bacterium]|nr:multidrug transporter [Fibrobacterota bacterium]
MGTRKPSRLPRLLTLSAAIILLSAGLAWILTTQAAAKPPSSATSSESKAKIRKVAMSTDSADIEIRPFRINVPEADLVDLRRRIAATRWPDKETVNDQSQGVQLAKIQDLAKYWGAGYDWRKCEGKLNALPQFTTNIDGLDIHFIHVRSRHPGAMPLIITHGWPGSILEIVKAIGPLTDPTAHGGRAEDAFNVVIPSMPGYGFSERPQDTGWGPDHIGRAWHELMGRLGYTRYVAQGGDWGSVISDAMGRQAPPGLLGIHVNMPAAVPGYLMKGILAGDAAPAGLSAKEKAAYEQMSVFFAKNGAYGSLMATRPQTLGYGLADSPVGLAAFHYDKFNQWTFSGGDAEKSLTKDEMLDDISVYWLTNTAVSSARLYWENNNNNFSAETQKTNEIKVPVGVTIFPGEIYRAPKSWVEKAYPTLTYFNEVDKGGHFAAWEEPELFAKELRAAFKPLR